MPHTISPFFGSICSNSLKKKSWSFSPTQKWLPNSSLYHSFPCDNSFLSLHLRVLSHLFSTRAGKSFTMISQSDLFIYLFIYYPVSLRVKGEPPLGKAIGLMWVWRGYMPKSSYSIHVFFIFCNAHIYDGFVQNMVTNLFIFYF